MGYIENLRDKRLNEFLESIEKLSSEESNDCYLSEDASIVIFTLDRKEAHETLIVCNKALNSFNKLKKEFARVSKDYYATRKRLEKQENSASEQEKQLLVELTKKFDTIVTEMKVLSDRNSKIKKIKKNLKQRLYNWCEYLFMVLISFFVASALYCNYIVVKIIGYIFSAVLLVGFIVKQILYTKNYLRAIKPNSQGTILYIIRKAFSVLLILWWYLLILVAANNWNSDICTYVFAAICALYIVFVICDLFLSSSFFDELENTVSFIAATLIGIALIASLIKNEFARGIAGAIIFVACLLLSLLLIKKFLIDKAAADSLPRTLSVVGMLLVTIVGTITSFYLVFWNDVDNTLFSSIVGVYAALIGGGLTLAGVAWTIKNTAKEKADEERKKAKPLFVSNMVFENIDARKEKVCFDEKDDTTSYVCHVIAEIENSKNSGFTMSQVYHDAQWRKIEGNSVILPDKKVYFDFLFTEDVNNLFLEVKDCLGNSYFYEIKVLQWALLTGVPASSSCIDHTIKELKEITLEDINERITKEVK